MPLIITYGIHPYIKDWPQAMPKKAPLRGAFLSNIRKRRCYKIINLSRRNQMVYHSNLQ